MHGFFELSKGAKILLAICAAVLIAEGLYINYVMGGAAFSVFSSTTTCERVVEKWENANPDLAKDRDLYTGAAVTVDFDGSPIKQVANFKTAINEAVTAGPNFAGKYAVAQWGCGTGCQGHAVVNIESGKIIAFGPETEAGLGISPESPIMITNPKENFPAVGEMQKANFDTLISLTNLPREYYVLEGTDDSNVRLQKICTENPFEGQGI